MTQAKKLKNRHFIVCCAIVIIATAALVCNAFMLGENFGGPIAKMDVTKSVKMYIPLDYKDTLRIKVTKGDSLWVLGMQGSQEKSRHALWVQNSRGDRGFIPVEELGYELMAENPQNSKLETVTVLGFDPSFSRYYCKFADETIRKIDHAKVFPQVPGDLKAHCINIEGPRVTMSADEFKDMVMGKTLDEIEQHTYPARLVVCHGDSTIAYFGFTDAIDFGGSQCHTHPIVRFDKDGIAASCSFDVTNAKADKYILRYLPLIKPLVDAPAIQNTIRTPFWTPSLFMTDAPPTLPHKALVVVFVVFALLWLWLTPLAPMALMGALMHLPATFKPINNLALRGLLILVTIVSCYVWFVAIQMWGHFWPLLIINVAIAYIAYRYIASPLDNFIPHDRCLKCRSLFAMDFVSDVFDHEYQEWGSDSKKVQTLSKKRFSYQTWTHVTTHYSNGKTYSHNENYQTHTGTTTTSLYNDYKVLYKVTVTKRTFKCSKCGHLEHDYLRSWQEIDRQHIGQHIDSSTHED